MIGSLCRWIFRIFIYGPTDAVRFLDMDPTDNAQEQPQRFSETRLQRGSQIWLEDILVLNQISVSKPLNTPSP